MTEYKCGSAESCQFGEMCKPNYNIGGCSHYKAEEPQTNEEMFDTLTTEEKAKVLARICVGAADDCDKGKTGKLYAPYWRRWLREEYRGKDFKIN